VNPAVMFSDKQPYFLFGTHWTFCPLTKADWTSGHFMWCFLLPPWKFWEFNFQKYHDYCWNSTFRKTM